MFLKKKISSILICFLLISCQGNNISKNSEKSDFKREIEQGLVLYNGTIEQSNSDGKILWRLSTKKVTYTQDKKIAILEGITGNLFEKDKIILQVSAKRGEVKNDGKEINLSDEIIAFDTRNKAEFKGQQVMWKPEENLMLMFGEKGIKANHNKLIVTAKQAKYNTKDQIVELNKNIIATTKNPSLQLKTEHLYWKIPENKLIGNHFLEMVRFDNNKIVTDKIKTNQTEVDLNTNMAIIYGNVEYLSLKPPLQAITDKIIWNYSDRILESKHPTKIIQKEDDMTLTANNAKFNLEENKIYLENGIYGKASKNEVEIYANNLQWNLENKEINADGNVYYKQINPDFNLKGNKAFGKLHEKKITLEGNQENPVTTLIYPKE